MHACELSLGLLLLIIFMACPSTSVLTSKGVNFEVEALMVIKRHLNDPTNALGSWDANSVDPCSWYHVTCSTQTSLVTNLGLPNLQLSGTLPPEIGNLTNLESLMLENNNISGQLPVEMGKLSKLVSLDLSNNHISGPLPQSLGQLNSLTYLRLNNNSFSGPFPPWLANIDVLDYLDLSYNNLSGHVPRVSATTFNVAGNPNLCGYGTVHDCPGEPPSPLSVPPNGPNEAGRSAQGRSKIEAIAVGTGAGSIVSIVLAVSAFMLWRRRRNQQIFFDTELGNSEVCLGQLKRFSFRELQTATENFHNSKILGRGGFGNVYKACLPDNTVVAVKRLKDRNAAGGEVQFQTEVEMISLAVHRNLLRLIGYCVTSTERLLVYPYMPNGSVASRLKEKPILDWPTRKRIAVGAARGLLYLHEQCDPKIIHRDVKAANILLDEEFEAVVGDFGLAKLLDHRQSHVTTTVRGTVGHIAPEYLFTGQSSDKTDVFGFGVLLLELITGQRAIDFGRHSNQRGLVLLEWVKVLQQEKRLVELVDDELKLDFFAGELEEMAQIALLCTQFDPADRPKMSEVLRMLEGDGLAERWDAWQRAEVDRSRSTELIPQRYFDLVEDSSLILEAVELSGPR